jgi:tetratricopeptide (TPR) repeat protein
MVHMMRNVLLALLIASLTGCAPKPVELDLQFAVTVDGKPIIDADIYIDGAIEGRTDASGSFIKAVSRLPDQTVRVAVRADREKIRTKPWESSVRVEPPPSGNRKETKAFLVHLERFVIVTAMHEGQPVAGAQVIVDGKPVGETGAQGEFEYTLVRIPKSGLQIALKKEGVGDATVTYKGDGGGQVEARLNRESIVTIEVLEDRNGATRPIKDATIAVAGREVGKTSADGTYVYRQKGNIGSAIAIGISAPGFLPGTAARSVKLAGATRIQHYFYAPTSGRPRAAVLGFAANTRGEDIGDVVKRVETAFVESIFDAKAFRQVPTRTALDLTKRSKISPEKIKTTGWRGTPLAEEVDVVILGSVARGPDDTFLIEASFYDPSGKLVMTQAAVAGSGGSWRVGRAVGEIVSNTIASYPFAGTVTNASGESVQINIGRNHFSLDRGAKFLVQSAKRDESGRIVNFADLGTTKIRQINDESTDTQPEALASAPRPGDRAVRIDSQSRAEGTERIVVTVKGGKGDAVAPVRGANLYVDQRWVGTTNRNGEASVPMRLGRKAQLLVYRHGFEQSSRTIEPAKAGERVEFSLTSYASEFLVESEPSGAAVSLDDVRIGKTPMTNPHSVALGFHSVKVDVGGDYRPYEEVIEFSKPEERRTGANRIVLHRDLLTLAERAENARQFDEAIRLYNTAPREHPDYIELRHRLGQLYHDDKRDYDRAIAEFERVQAIPEVDALVFKQYAVVYTNMGKAYYAKGDSLMRTNRNEAMNYFAKAIKALDRARENTRFFPAERHDEAVHDTYYYRALAYHNLYQVTKREQIATNAELAWNEYHDFFPAKLRGKPEFEHLRESGEKLAKQIPR